MTSAQLYQNKNHMAEKKMKENRLKRLKMGNRFHWKWLTRNVFSVELKKKKKKNNLTNIKFEHTGHNDVHGSGTR